MQINRYLKSHITSWLKDRMVFIGGPRQVGKTYLSKEFIKSSHAYMSWDDFNDRESIKKNRLPIDYSPVVIDELHKYPKWRTLLKGIYDKSDGKRKFIITGSARLDLFRKGGDSLFGRYHYLRLHPFSFSELEGQVNGDILKRLLEHGGFPEPFLKNEVSFSKIWRNERLQKVIHQDLRDLTTLRDYTELELLADLLPSKVGNLLSLNSLAEDLQKSPHTISHWIEILGSVYHCYLIAPYGSPKIKAIKKQKKLYLWDWSAVEGFGERFENLVASHLLKYCHFVEDTQGDKMELRYLRDQFGREIDFIVLKNKKPIFAVECKTGEKNLSPHIEYYRKKTPIPEYYQVHLGKKSYSENGISILPFEEFCKKIGLV